jgi:hypothetical protein
MVTVEGGRQRRVEKLKRPRRSRRGTKSVPSQLTDAWAKEKRSVSKSKQAKFIKRKA